MFKDKRYTFLTYLAGDERGDGINKFAEPEFLKDETCEEEISNEKDSNISSDFPSNCASLLRSSGVMETSNHSKGMINNPVNRGHADFEKLSEFNRELTSKYIALQAQYAELANERSQLQYRYNMLELAALQNAKGDCPSRARLPPGDDSLLIAQHSGIAKPTARRAVTRQEDEQVQADLRTSANHIAALQAQVVQLQECMAQKDRVIQSLLEERALKVARGVHAKILQNELMEMRGEIRVIVRYLPTSENFSNIEIVNPNIIAIRKPTFHFANLKGKPQIEYFKFHNIHNNISRNSLVFADVRDYVEACVEGNTAAIIANGPKGTGKTHNMVGPVNDAGIIPRALSLIAQICIDRESLWEFKISLSAIQIVDEEIYDLLPDGGDNSEFKQNWFGADNVDGLTHISLHDSGSSITLKNVTELEADTENKLIQIFCDAWQTHSKTSHAESAHFIVLVRIRAYGKVPMFQPPSMGAMPGKMERCNRQMPHQNVSHGFLIMCDLASFDRLSNKKTRSAAAWVLRNHPTLKTMLSAFQLNSDLSHFLNLDLYSTPLCFPTRELLPCYGKSDELVAF
ncbi:hypothetical protein Aperf_G00000125194 [Anoplocephala perfoliata]